MKQCMYPVLLSALLLFAGCGGSHKAPAGDAVNAINLKRGNMILCGPPDRQLGAVDFDIACSGKVRQDFDVALALLHSFEYDEAEKVFAKIIDEEPACAMAYWGVAMCNYHPLWTPPTRPELEKGSKAIAIAQSLGGKTAKETAYIEAIASFYRGWDKLPHTTRSRNFENAMAKIYAGYPGDKEAAIFYALALNGAADPADKTYSRQKKAGAILTALYPGQPYHPGIVHYIIHSYDVPELAAQALPAARKYASIAPSSAHAQHMPSHIFTRLGLWDESIRSNLASVNMAKCYAESAGIKGHWDEELHGMDYLVYAYLQKADNVQAKAQWDYLRSIQNVYPQNFKVAYAFAAIPARYLLENRMWQEAAALELHPAGFPWEQYPWQKAIVHFTKALGAVHTGNTAVAEAALKSLAAIHDTLLRQQDAYKANQVEIQLKAARAWMLLKGGRQEAALALMDTAARMEDNTQKHPVTPGEVIPARELLGDMLLAANRPRQAMEAYEAALRQQPNRFNGIYGAARAAQRIHNNEKAGWYYRQLMDMADVHTTRPELEAARRFLKKAPALALR